MIEPAVAPVAAPAVAPAVDGKEAAGGPDMVLTTDILAKIAALILSQEDGEAIVEKALAKEAGAERARETLVFLADQSELAQKQAAHDQGMADAQSLIDQEIFEAGKQAATPVAPAAAPAAAAALPH